MILLDTDHISVLRMPASERQSRLVGRMAGAGTETFGVPIVVVEETMRGWLAAIARERQAERQVSAYRELASLFQFFAAFPIEPFDDTVAAQFNSLKAARIRIAARDLKIAAIALVSGSLLLTANRRDFEKVPGLRFDNWLD